MSEFGWTPEQARAITAEGHTLLAASAGTGKTTTIVGKILWLLGLDVGRSQDGEPLPACRRPASLREIAAITFTEKAAYDLKRKLRGKIEASAEAERLRWEIDRASVGTIHAFCAEILRETALRFGIDPSFRVLDEREARVEMDSVIKDVLFEALEAGEHGSRTLLQRFGLQGFKNVDGTIDHIRKVVRDLRWHEDRYELWFADRAAFRARLIDLDPGFDAETESAQLSLCAELLDLAGRVERRWRAYLRRETLRDFDSLILDARSLLTGSDAGPAIARLRRRFRVLIIDEFQDTDAAQRDIALAIAGLSEAAPAGAPQLFLVGDAKQSIYGFRGADISVWNETRESICEVTGPLELTRNFRSDPEVIAFANAAAGRAVGEIGEAVAEQAPESHVAYSDLVPGRGAAPAGGVEWLAADTSPVARQRDLEAEHVATRIVELVDQLTVEDPDTGIRRPCRYRDIAILYRNTTGLEQYERVLRRYGIPFFSLGITGFGEAQEILDLVTAIRVIDNPRDDLQAFAFLRSPFIGLRDEVIARLRIEGGYGSLLRQAYRFAEEGTGWFADAGDDERIADIEREALIRGLDAIKRARRMAGRAPLDELLSDLIEHTGYRLHLLLTERSAEALANIEKFLTLLEDYRDRPLGSFLEIWDRWDDLDTLVPQAPLYSKEDDVVTLSTIHGAKGLEWPVVFLVGTGQRFQDRLTNQFWSDAEYGPLLCPRRDERTARAIRLHARRTLAERAEEARLLYVAVTRARDRLLIVGPPAGEESYAGWLAAGAGLVESRSVPASVPPPDPPVDVELGWMDELEERAVADSSEALPAPPTRFTTSATEAMKREADPKEWALRYLHGIIETWRFAPHPSGEGSDLPPTERGKLIHDVLERIQEEEELAELLDERIGAADAHEIEVTAAPGTAYRAALENEIREVIRGEDWRWYVDGEHYRELRFIRLVESDLWEVGALDLYRPSRVAAADERDAASWIIDFKTHQISAAEMESTARRYRIQGDVYRAAGSMKDSPRVLLHFTHPNQVTELAASDRDEQIETVQATVGLEERVAVDAPASEASEGDQLLLFD